ncbi:MAG: ffh [Chlamydiales bacterium]|jgi:signal recognition particle subunit SRP54|nr:ffh [Chlamydiales bacterium]
MLSTLTDKLHSVFDKLSGQGKLTESNIAAAADEVRLALLEADVNYGVTKTFVKAVKEKALGQASIKSVQPGQQFIKIVHDELKELMGGQEPTLATSGSPPVWMLCGLQGAGKTTHTVKLARYLKRQKLAQNPLVVACDLQRPAAVLQLKTLADQGQVGFFAIEGCQDPVQVAKESLQYAKEHSHDFLLLDTAGRLHIDEALMLELEKIRDLSHPQEILFVANASTGQDAVKSAAEFNQKLSITGSILTMLDGNTRGGAAISIREVTKKPLKFEGIGEKLDDIQLFNPSSMADRILGMGDTINLVKKAQEHLDEQDAKKLEQKIRTATFSYDDYLKQTQAVKKMGSIKSLLSMLPGMSKFSELEISDKEFFKIEAIILSMTPAERLEKVELIPMRRKRIARGSGTSIDDVNKLIKSFKQAKQFFKNLPSMKHLEKLMGGNVWR